MGPVGSIEDLDLHSKKKRGQKIVNRMSSGLGKDSSVCSGEDRLAMRKFDSNPGER